MHHNVADMSVHAPSVTAEPAGYDRPVRPTLCAAVLALSFVAALATATSCGSSSAPPGGKGTGGTSATGGSSGGGGGTGGTGSGGAEAGSGGAPSATGGTAGAASGGAGAGTGGATGGNTGGRGGGETGGEAGGAGGKPGGGGGAGTGGPRDGGSEARQCDQVQCLRPYVCVRTCGAAPEYTGCCPCEPPLFDDFGSTSVCADGGQQTATYLGCRFIGGVNRLVVSKRDTARNLCVNVVLAGPGASEPGLMTPPNYGLERATAGTAAQCPARGVVGLVASQVTGTVTIVSGGTGSPNALSADLTVTFPSNDAGVPTTELIRADNIDVRAGCTQ